MAQHEVLIERAFLYGAFAEIPFVQIPAAPRSEKSMKALPSSSWLVVGVVGLRPSARDVGRFHDVNVCDAAEHDNLRACGPPVNSEMVVQSVLPGHVVRHTFVEPSRQVVSGNLAGRNKKFPYAADYFSRSKKMQAG